MHDECRWFVRRILNSLPPSHRVVEFGSRDINGSIRSLFASADVYLGIDMMEGPAVDLVQDVTTWHTDERFDTVLCLEVLEHTDKAADILEAAHRVLQDDGVLIVTAATTGREPHSAIDTEPIRPDEFYRNVTADLLLEWLEPFARYKVETDSLVKDIRAVAWRS